MVAHNGRYSRRAFTALGAGATAGLFAVSRHALAQDATPVGSPEVADMGAFDATGLTEIVVTAEEFTFSGSTPGALAEGWYIITLVNESETATNVNLGLLPEDVSGGDLSATVSQSFMGQGGELPDWWMSASFAGGPMAEGGASASTLAYLTPGNWYLFKTFPAAMQSPSSIAVLTPEELEANYGVAPEEGSATPVADAEPAGTAAPEGVVATVTIDVADDSVTADGAPAGGEQVLQVTNSGAQVHDLVILHSAETVDEAGAASMASSWLTGEETGATVAGGVGTLSPEATAFVAIDVQPGNYVVFSSGPDANTGGLQVDSGVVTIFTAQ